LDGSGRESAQGDLRALVAAQAERLALLDTVIEAAPVGIGVVDLDGRTPLTNETLRRLLGYTREEFAALPFAAYTHPDDVAANQALFAQMIAGELDRFEMQKRFVRKDGGTLWADLTVSLVRDGAGRPEYSIGMTQDITERKRLADELRAAELHYRLLVEHVPAVVYIAEPGPTGPWRYVSPRIEHMLGIAPHELRDDPRLWATRIHPDDLQAVQRHEAEVTARGVSDDLLPSFTYRMRHRDGRTLWVRDDAMLLADVDGRLAFHGVLVDVTQEKQLEERLAHLADHDALTGLVNRAHLHRLIDRALDARAAAVVGGGPEADAAPPVAVLFVDLDDFKSVNDGYGHATGDRVLGAVAGRLMSASPPGSTAARIGGDEFAVLVLGDVDVAEAAERVCAAVQDVRVAVAGEPVPVTASVGWAVAERWHTTELLLHDADQAMYRAKLRGGAGASGVLDAPRSQ
jgi:diguanylate cyclase (GGDEF)-like protein/PAS domain S-box-containing protein